MLFDLSNKPLMGQAIVLPKRQMPNVAMHIGEIANFLRRTCKISAK